MHANHGKCGLLNKSSGIVRKNARSSQILSKIIRFSFVVSIENIAKSALVNCERNVVQPEIDAQRNGRDTSLKHLHKQRPAMTRD